jgi:Flp pilus assembly protein TadD
MITIAPLLIEAETYLTRRDVDRAAELYRRALELDGHRSPLPMVGLARVALLIGRVSDAARLLDRVLERFPQCVEALTFRAAACEAQGQLLAASELLNRALGIDPRYAPARTNLGRLAALEHRWSQAVHHLERVTEPTTDVTLLLGIALVRVKRLEEAVRVLSEGLSRAPERLDAYLCLADALVEAGSLPLADRVLENAAMRFPREEAICSKRAALAMRQGNTSAARALVRRQLELAPKNVEAWLLAGVLALAQKDLDSAWLATQEALKLAPQESRAHAQLGGIAEALRLFPAALKAYRDAVRLDPRAWSPRNNLAILLLEAGDAVSLREACTLLEQAAALAPEEPQPRFNLALARHRLGDRAGSQAEARRAAAMGPPGDATRQAAARFLKEAA